MGRIGEGLHTAGQHLVGIGLMGDVEDYLVFGSVKDIVKRDDGFDHAQIGADMATVSRKFLEKLASHLGCKHCEHLQIHFSDICRRLDLR